MTESGRLKDEQQFWRRVRIALKLRDEEARENHPAPEQMTDYLEGLLKGKERDRLASHFQLCESCSEELTMLRGSYSPPIHDVIPNNAKSPGWNILTLMRPAYALPLAAVLLIALVVWDPMMIFHTDVQSVTALAEQYLAEGKYADASATFNRALQLAEGTEGFNRSELAQIMERLAFARMQEGELGKADELYRRALHIRESEIGRDALSTGQLIGQMADLRRRQGDQAGAALLQSRAEDIFAGVSRDTLLDLVSRPVKRVRKYAALALLPPLSFRGKDRPRTIPTLELEPDVTSVSLTMMIPRSVQRPSFFGLSLVPPSGRVIPFNESFSPSPSESRLGDDTLRISLERDVFPQVPGRYTLRLTGVPAKGQGSPDTLEYTFDLDEPTE